MKRNIRSIVMIIVMMSVISSCATDGWTRQEYIEQHVYVGKVQVSNKYINTFFMIKSADEKRKEMDRMLLKKAKEVYGKDVEIDNIIYDSSLSIWSILASFTVLGFVENVKATASIYNPILEKENKQKIIEAEKLEMLAKLKARYEKYQSPILIGLMITSPPNSAKGVSFIINGMNISNKEIKYLTFKIVAFNRVHDIVQDEVSGKAEKICQITGPIGINETYTAKFENVWYNNTIAYSIIQEIEVIFMDNSAVKITEKEVIDQLFDPIY